MKYLVVISLLTSRSLIGLKEYPSKGPASAPARILMLENLLDLLTEAAFGAGLAVDRSLWLFTTFTLAEVAIVVDVLGFEF